MENIRTGKPRQPDDVKVDDLINFGGAVKGAFDYLLLVLKEKFEKAHNTTMRTTVVPLKSRKRINEKIEKDDDIYGASDILDVVRGTVSFKTVEELLDFLQFISTTKFTEDDFTQNYDFLSPSFNDESFTYISEKLNENGEPVKDEKGNAVLEKTHTIDKLLKRYNPAKYLMNNLPRTDICISNSFLLDVDEKQRKKYRFLTKKPSLKPSNYMDFKFYVKIPIPSFIDGKGKQKGDFLICEVIATLDCFVDVYEKTHVIYEVIRTFTPMVGDDLPEQTFKKVLKALLRAIHVDDVITNYNVNHPNSIQILPYNDNKEERDEMLNRAGSSIALTKALCQARDL